MSTAVVVGESTGVEEVFWLPSSSSTVAFGSLLLLGCCSCASRSLVCLRVLLYAGPEEALAFGGAVVPLPSAGWTVALGALTFVRVCLPVAIFCCTEHMLVLEHGQILR